VKSLVLSIVIIFVSRVIVPYIWVRIEELFVFKDPWMDSHIISIVTLSWILDFVKLI